MKEKLLKLIAGQTLSREETRDIMLRIIEQKCNNSQVAALLMAIQTRGATVDEILGLRDGLLETGKYINLEDYTDDDQVFHRSGSAFVPNMRMVRPFEAYAVAGGAGARSLDLNSYLWGDVTDMMRIEMDKLIDIAKNRRIFDLSGRRVSETSVKNKAKLDHQRIYIINGKKTVVK